MNYLDDPYIQEALTELGWKVSQRDAEDWMVVDSSGFVYHLPANILEALVRRMFAMACSPQG